MRVLKGSRKILPEKNTPLEESREIFDIVGVEA